MANDASALLHELNNLVESRTFTADAAAGIAKLRERVIEADGKIVELHRDLERERRATAKFSETIDKLAKQVEKFKLREAALIEREAKANKLETDLAVAAATGKAFDKINRRILANRIVREDIFHSNQVPIPNNTGGYYTAPQTETKQHTIKDEQ